MKASTGWFEYHCTEAEWSQDAELWHHTHERYTVIAEIDNDGLSYEVPTARIRLASGYEGHAVMDELLASPDEYYRPDYVQGIETLWVEDNDG